MLNKTWKLSSKRMRTMHFHLMLQFVQAQMKDKWELLNREEERLLESWGLGNPLKDTICSNSKKKAAFYGTLAVRKVCDFEPWWQIGLWESQSSQIACAQRLARRQSVASVAVTQKLMLNILQQRSRLIISLVWLDMNVRYFQVRAP